MRNFSILSISGFFLLTTFLLLTVQSESLAAPLHALSVFALQTSSEDTSLTDEEIWDRAQATMGEEDYGESARYLRLYIKRNPEEVKAWLHLARVLSWSGEHAEAIEWYDNLVAVDPLDTELAIERVHVLSWKGDYQEAEQALRLILSKDRENIEANLALGQVLEWRQRPEEAQEVYDWVIKVDPGNREARLGKDSARRSTGVALEWEAGHSGDNQGFRFFHTRLGLPLSSGPEFSLVPYLTNTVITDSNNPVRTGIGGGLGLRSVLFERWSLAAEGGVHYYPYGDGIMDWAAKVKTSVSVLDSLYLSLALHTMLYGPVGQSIKTLESELRAWGGQASAYWEKGRVSLFGLLSLDGLVSSAYPTSLVTTGMLHPMVRVAGDRTTLSVGYKLWYKGHSKDAPEDLGYWSPAQYLTHQAMVRLAGKIGQSGTFHIGAGGGLGQEFKPASTLLGAENSASWSVFPAIAGSAGIDGHIIGGLHARLSGWTVFSQRTQQSITSRYLLWNMDAGLVYRW